jgi:hypothetical protein
MSTRRLCLLKTSSAAEILVRYRPKCGPETRSKFEFPIRTRKFPVLCHLDEEQAIAVRRSLRHRSLDLDASFAFVDQVRNVGGGLMESRVVPTANSKRLTATANRSILAADERPLQVDLVRLDRTVPAAGCVGSREPYPSTSTQRVAAQIPKAVGVR